MEQEQIDTREDDDTAVKVFSAILTLLRFIISGHDTRRRLRRTIRRDKSATRTDPSEAAQESFAVAAAQMRGRRSVHRRLLLPITVSYLHPAHIFEKRQPRAIENCCTL